MILERATQTGDLRFAETLSSYSYIQQVFRTILLLPRSYRGTDRIFSVMKADSDDAVQRLPVASRLSLPPPRRPLPPHTLILAPMVGGSELAFRLLARRHGAQLCYTPMMHSEQFTKFKHTSAGYGPLETHPGDAPLVAHFSGNDPHVLLRAAREAEACSGVVAIDLNLGCPQRSAHSGHFGAFLSDPEDRPLLLRIVSTLARNLRVPLFCKIRLLDDIHSTIDYARQLQDAGCSLLAVHARYRGSPMHRRDGPAQLDQGAANTNPNMHDTCTLTLRPISLFIT